MRKLKYSIIFLISLGSLFFLFGPEVIPENLQFQTLLNSAAQNDVIIIFNSGGWGNTPLEEAEDFAPIMEGIQAILNEWGYNLIIIPYERTKNTLLGKIAGAKDFFSSFQSSSEILAEKIEFLTKKFPDKKIILAGLSAGGALVEETMKKISEDANNSVYAIAAGIPFWSKPFESENTLRLNNNGKDSLAAREIKALISSLVKAPFKWVLAKVRGENLSFSQAIQVPGHEYSWSSSEVGPQIVSFLKEKLK